ncbi:MAG TPA: uroporphyrinogen-III synthase [Actinomycetota bacterium]|nr:uroporphyrinogen-III synthase [Actinomycetota bacterium]
MTGRLAGRRVLVLRPKAQAAELANLLAWEGAEPVLAPAIRILPPDDFGPIEAALGRGQAWTLFTSVNGVEALRGRLRPGRLGQVAAVGPATAAALTSEGIHTAFIPSAYTTVALAEELPGPPSATCLVRADIAAGDLEAILRRRGFSVERVDAYRTESEDPAPIREALAGLLDAVALTSASITRAFAQAADGHPMPPLVSIGPATSAAARDAGLDVAAEARPHTMTGLVEALVAALRGTMDR